MAAKRSAKKSGRKKAASRALQKRQAILPTVTEEEWEAQLKGSVEEGAALVAGSGGVKWISTRGGTFTFDENDLGDELPVIIVDARRENAYYSGAFDPSSPQSPVCAAIGIEQSGMVPSQESPDIQNEECDDCWANKFGSADTGRGKACKNSVRLILLAATDLSPSELMKQEYAILRLPVTSVKHFSKYVRKIGGLTGRPMHGVVTTLKIIQSESNQYEVTFEFQDKLDAGAGAVVLQNRTTCQEDLTSLNFGIRDEAPPKRGGPKKAARKKAGKKKAARKRGNF